MNIYFSGSIRGGSSHHEWYDFIIQELQKHGEVLSDFVKNESIAKYGYGKNSYTDEEYYSRDIKNIKEKVDILIADITVPSFGVGYEIAYAQNLNKKVVCIYHKVDDKKMSAMLAGNPDIKIFPYKNKEELVDVINNIFN